MGVYGCKGFVLREDIAKACQSNLARLISAIQDSRSGSPYGKTFRGPSFALVNGNT